MFVSMFLLVCFSSFGELCFVSSLLFKCKIRVMFVFVSKKFSSCYRT